MLIFLLLSCQYIGSNNLTGGIPSEFGMIESMTNLDLGKIIQTENYIYIYIYSSCLQSNLCMRFYDCNTTYRWEYFDGSYTNRAWTTHRITRYWDR